jgi:serine/threonine-protein phosphatase 5
MADLPQYKSGGLITENFISQAIGCFRTKARLGKDTILNLIHAAQQIFESQLSLIEINLEEGEKITVCGDVHGDFTANLPCKFANQT